MHGILWLGTVDLLGVCEGIRDHVGGCVAFFELDGECGGVGGGRCLGAAVEDGLFSHAQLAGVDYDAKGVVA